jgi:hypothetical protein
MGLDHNSNSIKDMNHIRYCSIALGNVGSMFDIVINAVTIHYLYRANVKAFFVNDLSSCSMCGRGL